MDTVRFFFKKDFYVCYESDANLIADEFYNSRTVIKVWELAKKGAVANKQAKIVGPSYINLSQALTETIIRTLINEKKMKIEIYSLGDDRRWFLFRKGSPGNHQQLEEILYNRTEINDSPIMVAVTVTIVSGQRVVGAAFCDNLLKKIFICEFLDGEQLVNLESLLIQISARECYTLPLDEKDKEGAKILDILNRCEIVHSPRKKSDFDTKSIEQDLRRLLGTHYVDAHSYLELNHGMAATAAILSGLELTSVDGNLGAFRMYRYDLSQFMRLDSAAVQALNLVPYAKEANQQYNLYGLLNKCKTAMGSRKLMQWIKQPLVSREAIERRLDIVEVLVTDTAMLGEIRMKGLRGISDVERITKKIQRSKGNLQDCVLLYAFTQKLPRIAELLQSYCGDVHKALLEKAFIARFDDFSSKFQKFVNLIEEAVDLSKVDEGEYIINPEFDPVLGELEEQRGKLRTAMKKRELEVKLILKSPDHFALEYDKAYGWVYRVTKKEEKILETKENKSKFIVLANNKTGIKFQDKQLQVHSEEYIKITTTYNDNCRDIMVGMMKCVAGFLPVFEAAHELVAELDVFAAFADTSQSAMPPYVRPTIHQPGEGNTVLIQSRHPVLEATPDIKFVPNDCRLVRGESSFIIITGPNMGGKSTFIRQVGVNVLMAQIGCFIPCDEGSSVCIADAILARVGAGDSQLRGVSTFMAEMLETATILKTATKDSLIIIDELGRGTSTYDGFGLAWAISEFICTKLDAFCLFATHFHELTQLQEEIPAVKNLHVSAVLSPEQGLILQYNVEDGPSDQSFGIHVAKMANFPQSVIDIATQKAAELENFDKTSKNLISRNVDMTGEETQADAFFSTILSQLSDLPMDKMNPAEIRAAMDEIKKQVVECEIPLVKELLASELS